MSNVVPTGRAARLITRLRLEPHPEGGFYREMFRSAERVARVGSASEWDAVTTILYLLTDAGHSRWHRVTSDEVWHHYEGGPLELLMAPPDASSVLRVVIGDALETEGPVYTVPAGWWQAARAIGAYTLAGCTVAPGFQFSDFSFLRDHQDALDAMTRLDKELARLA